MGRIEIEFSRRIMPKLFPLIWMLALLAAPAGAVLIDDEPCNDAIAPSGPCPSGAPIQLTSIGAGVTTGGSDGFSLSFRNSDYFGVAGLVAGDILVVSTTPLDDPPWFQDPDTVVGLFDSATIDPTIERLCIGDDTFNTDLPPVTGFGSLCRYEIQTAGTYFVGITGFDADDILFDDNHFQSGDYALTVTVISAPEPGLMLQLAAGVVGVGALNKRRLRRNCRTERARAV
jgi:hypothetical protein